MLNTYCIGLQSLGRGHNIARLNTRALRSLQHAARLETSSLVRQPYFSLFRWEERNKNRIKKNTAGSRDNETSWPGQSGYAI